MLDNLKFRIETYCNNSQVKQLMQLQDGPSKVREERLTGKEGQIRTIY